MSGKKWSAILLLAALGCGGPERGLVLTTPHVEAPALLESELGRMTMPLRLEAPLRFENRSSTGQILALTNKGCSCYGLASADGLLEEKQDITVPPNGSLKLYFVAKLAGLNGDQAYRAGFVLGENRTDVRADAEQPIMSDLDLEPDALFGHIAAGRAIAESADEKPLMFEVRRVARNRHIGYYAPAMIEKPPFVTASQFPPEASAEEISPGLFRAVWRTTLTIGELPAEVAEAGGRFPIRFQFPELTVITGPGLQARGPVEASTAPPLVSTMMTYDPPREISGQLVLRKLRGIVAPRMLHFGRLKVDGQAQTRRLVLTATDKRSFKATAHSVPENASVEFDSSDAAAQHWATVIIRATSAGEIAEALVIQTDHPDEPEIRIILRGTAE
jgi:hypothetical protein